MSDKITTAATRYVNAVDAARTLRKARNACDCAHMPPMRDEEGAGGALHPDGQPWQNVPCWRPVHRPQSSLTQEEYYTVHPAPFGDGSARGWCSACEKRQKLHGELLAAVRARTGAMASLRAAVRRGAP